MLLLFCGSKIFGQEIETKTEALSSSWLRIGISAPRVSKTAVTKKKPAPHSSIRKHTPVSASATPTTPKSDEFNKTNSKIKRFQKEKVD